MLEGILGVHEYFNYPMLFDDYFAWKAKAMAKDIETHIFAHTGVEELEQEKIETEMNYEHYKVHEPSPEDELPLKWCEAAPCMGKKVATLHITASSDTHLKLIWSGNTWALLFCRCANTNTQNTKAFRDKMDEAGIKGPLYFLSLRCLFV